MRIKKEKEVAELEALWRDYPLLIGQAPEGSKLHDTAQDSVTIKQEWIPENLEDDKDGEKKVNTFPISNFAYDWLWQDEICHLAEVFPIAVYSDMITLSHLFVINLPQMTYLVHFCGTNVCECRFVHVPK